MTPVKKLALTLIITVGLSIGFAIQQAELPTTKEGTQTSAPTRSRSSQKASSREPIPKVEKLSYQVQRQPGPEPILRWIAQLENTSLTDLPRFSLSLSPPPFVTGMRENRVEDELFSRYWVERDPLNLFKHANILTKESAENLSYSDAYSFARAAIQELVKSNPDKTISLLEKDNQYPLQNRLREVVINSLMREDPERALEYTVKWKNWDIRPELGKEFQAWVEKNPAHAASFVLSESYLASKGDFLIKVAKTWAEKSPEAALQFAISSKSSFAPKLMEESFRTWTKNDLDGAGRWLAQIKDPTTANNLTLILVESWGKESPVAAITWSEAHLHGAQLSKAISSFLPKQVIKNPAEISALLNTFTDPTARSLAELTAADTFFNEFRRQDIQRPPFPAGKDWIEKIEDSVTLGQVLHQASHCWSKEDPESLLSLLNERSDSDFENQTYQVLAIQLIDTAPSKTLDWITRIPSQHLPDATSSAFYSWMKKDPQAADEWFSELPTSDPRASHAFDDLADQITYWPKQKIEAALEPLSSRSRQALKDSLQKAETSSPDRKKARAFVLERIAP